MQEVLIEKLEVKGPRVNITLSDSAYAILMSNAFVLQVEEVPSCPPPPDLTKLVNLLKPPHERSYRNPYSVVPEALRRDAERHKYPFNYQRYLRSQLS